jgi:hypothetical protein
MRFVKIRLTLVWLLIGACSEAALGDGGTLRLSRPEGNYRISIFTAPNPFRAGPVDISVLVQDAITGAAIPEAAVTVQLMSRDHVGKPICYAATDTDATNKLLKSAVFDLPEPGRWVIKVTIAGEQGTANVQFELEAGQSVQEWPAMWPWITWPAFAISLYFLHQVLVWRKHRGLTQKHQLRL